MRVGIALCVPSHCGDSNPDTLGKTPLKMRRGVIRIIATGNKKSAVGLIQQRFSVGHFVPHVSSFSTSKIWVQQN
ncbi:hypothetical protein AWB75_00061 [Caballeronia catudaia]|uniref:Uncharacterized protein n=1 Tax=Caballeronia catudaia TaxID=1777136 RepID=A0A157Z1U6_9BURK|nr:hypothetical protein AWB75_00061 [Caballeronia catudaia]